MSGTICLSSVTVNCPDAIRLANFYAHVVGGTVTMEWGLGGR